MEKKQCDTTTISVHIGSLKSNIIELPTGLEEFAHKMIEVDSTDHQGVVRLVIPYATFTDKVRLYRMCFCHTPAGFDDKGCLHPRTVVAIAHVVLKPSISCKLKACAAGLVYSPTWHCGYTEELQSCFTERKLIPELVPVLQQLELATTIEVKSKLCEVLRKPVASFKQDFKRKVCFLVRFPMSVLSFCMCMFYAFCCGHVNGAYIMIFGQTCTIILYMYICTTKY